MASISGSLGEIANRLEASKAAVSANLSRPSEVLDSMRRACREGFEIVPVVFSMIPKAD